MIRVGLTGGIASGKSVVSQLFAEHGAVVIDSDVLAREVVQKGTPGLAAVVEAFGPGILDPSGDLDRPALGRLVFADVEARRRLEAIVHPLVRARATEIERAEPADAVVVHDIPLLVETGQQDKFDTIVVVDAPVELQLERLTGKRGMGTEEARARIAAQATRQQRLAAADHVIVNDDTIDGLRAAVVALWKELQLAG